MKEDGEILQKLAGDVRQRNWKAVTADVAAKSQEEVRSLRLKKSELRELHCELLRVERKAKLGVVHI